jgi:hypothetical protein
MKYNSSEIAQKRSDVIGFVNIERGSDLRNDDREVGKLDVPIIEGPNWVGQEVSEIVAK